MQCSKYPERAAAGVCSFSGKPYSSEELVEIDGRMYAKDHLPQVMALAREEGSKVPQQNSMVFMNAGGGASSSSSASTPDVVTGTKSKVSAGVLALLLGGLGVHKFYLGQAGMGILYLLFCWTFIPGFIALIEAISYFTMSDAVFARKYG